jgi:hypothetical protein
MGSDSNYRAIEGEILCEPLVVARREDQVLFFASEAICRSNLIYAAGERFKEFATRRGWYGVRDLGSYTAPYNS